MSVQNIVKNLQKLPIVIVASANYLICVERSFFRDSASCCSCCVRVVVSAHDYQNRDKGSTLSSILLPKTASNRSEGTRKMQYFCKEIF